MSASLAIIPAYLSQPSDLAMLLDCLTSIQQTEPDLQVLVVDDGSPAPALVDEVEAATSRLQFELHRKDENSGFSRTVNVGLQRALENEQNAILINADIVFDVESYAGWKDRTGEPGWVGLMEQQPSKDVDNLAWVVGARLLYPNGLIQHAGIFYSLLHTAFDHRFRHAPSDLPEAMQAFRCPVTGALQFIRHEALATVGLYDENFLLGWEDVDYALRVFRAEQECIYQPRVWAWHHESVFRGRKSRKLEEWQAKSWIYFMRKYARVSFAEWLPTWI